MVEHPDSVGETLENNLHTTNHELYHGAVSIYCTVHCPQYTPLPAELNSAFRRLVNHLDLVERLWNERLHLLVLQEQHQTQGETNR